MDDECKCPLCEAGIPTKRMSSWPGNQGPRIAVISSPGVVSKLKAAMLAQHYQSLELDKHVEIIEADYSDIEERILAHEREFIIDSIPEVPMRPYGPKTIDISSDEDLIFGGKLSRKQRRAMSSKKGNPPNHRTDYSGRKGRWR